MQNLLCYSDVDYLMAVCAHNIGDTARAVMCFENFINYSESIIPGSFCYKNIKNAKDIKGLSENGYAKDSLYSGHFTEFCKGPVLKHYPYCGFLYKLEDKPIMDIALGMGYDGTKINMFYSLGMTFKYGFKPYIITQLDGWGGGIKYQIYRRWDNRLGVLTDLQYRNLTLDIGDFENIKFRNYSLELQTGYYLLPHLCFFLGGKYYYLNEKNKYFSNTSGYYIWNENDYYSGASFFLFEHLALVGKYSRNKKAQVGLYLFGVDMLFDFSKTKDFVVDATYW